MGKTFKILPPMCSQQQHDLEELLTAADEIGAAATSVIAQGGHGYNLLFEARDKFRKILFESANRYRVVIEKDEVDESSA